MTSFFTESLHFWGICFILVIAIPPKNQKGKDVDYVKNTRKLLALALALMMCVSMVPTAAAATYTVVEGDSLWKIAQKQYNEGKRWGEIYEANRDILSNPNVLQIGQVLEIPNGTETPAPAPAPEPEPEPVAPTPEPEPTPCNA